MPASTSCCTIGFNEAKAERLVGDYSGGWQMRIALGKILLQEPDLLLLDEPTNHLDMATIEWLEVSHRDQCAAGGDQPRPHLPRSRLQPNR